MAAAVFERAQYAVSPPVRRGGLRSLPFAVPERAREAMEYFADVLEQQFYRPALAAPTKAAFAAFWKAHGSRYMETIDGFRAALVTVLSEEGALSEVASAFDDSHRDLADRIAEFAGDERRDQFDFASSTFRAALGLVLRFPSLNPPRDGDADASCARRFRSASAQWTVATDCLYFVVAEAVPVAPEVLDALFEGAREVAFVAYATAREARDLRAATEEAEASPAPDPSAVALADEDFEEAARITDLLDRR